MRSLLGIASPVLLVLLLWTAPASALQGTPIGYEEEFALALDREAALEQLIPGTPEYYYYSCLQAQNTGALDSVEPLLAAWVERHGRDARVEEIENRQALLEYETDPAATYEFLKRRLGLRFDHQRDLGGQKPDLPTALDQSLISRAALTERALRLHSRSVDGFRESAFEFLVQRELDERQTMSLLERLVRPDLPNLPALVVRNLRTRASRGFGSLGIHSNLLLAQLEECVALMPELLNDQSFVGAYLRRLLPGADVNWQRDARAREAYLDRLEAFTRRLAPAHNSLKAHVLHRRLVHDLAEGTPDKERFLAYLRLPRPSSHVNPRFLERRSRDEEMVDLARDYPTQLGPIRDDEAVVHAYLEHFFATEDSYESYVDYLRRDYLERAFAEAKILAGSGDMERWYSLLDDPAYYEQLKERVELGFPPTQRTDFGAREPVSIAVDVKNVDTLLVKVFEVNTRNYYAEEQREVDASLNVDGLVASDEQTYTYDESPLRRVRRTFDFTELTRPGVYIVEFIGNGLSSRAVVRKGRLAYVERMGSAGHVFQIHDESGQLVQGASIRADGREYTADEHGEVLIPYSTQPGRRTIVLHGGGLSTVDSFEHAGESYVLDAAIGVEREALLARRVAQVLVRPSLLLNGRPVPLALLEEPVLTIESRDLHGVQATAVVRDFELFEDQESVHEIQVPEGLVWLRVSLRGQVKNLSQGETTQLAAPARTLTLNGIETTAATSSPLLGRTARGYMLDLLGKNGEPKADRAVELRLTHEDFSDPLTVTLKTDARGRIRLGALAGIEHVQASGFAGGVGGWILRDAARTYPSSVHGLAGSTLRVPYQGAETSTSRAAVSLLELRGGAFAYDRFDKVALKDGFLELRGLAPGDYDLWLAEARRHIGVSVTAGVERAGWAVGADRALELEDGSGLHVVGTSVDADQLVIELAGASPATRVHVVATRYLPAFDKYGALVAPRAPALRRADVLHADSSYHSGRSIGDEYRYILDRRYAKKYPGNMLRRPGLLLNPWALEETNTLIGLGGGAGGAFGGRRGGSRDVRSAGGAASEGAASDGAGGFPSLEFLPRPSVTLANLRPGADGVLRVPLADLGDGQLAHVVAVDEQATVYATHALPEQRLVPADQRLDAALDVARHFTEQRAIEFLDAGASAVLADRAMSSAETYDSLATVHQLFTTLTGDPDLAEFAFLLRWPTMTPEEQREQYAQHACHELHFFLHEKDPAFFDEVVRPYLANKAHKTFLDHWLLDADLAAYLEPWAFERLNIVERILLARRLPGEAAGVARHVGELLELQPPDSGRTEELFETALKSKALDVSAGKDLARAPSGGLVPADEGGDGRPARSRNAPGAPDAAEAEPMEDAEELDADAMNDKAGEARGRRAEKSEESARDQLRRANVRPLYRGVAETREYVEHDYWHRRVHEQGGDMIPVNAFWEDLARAADDRPFVSTHFAEATGSFAEMMLALAVLDLPFTAGEHAVRVEGTRLTLEAKSPLLLVRKELRDASAPAEEDSILISQSFFRLDDRYRYDGNQRRDKFVADEFVVDVPYGCQVVLTNPTSAPRELELLMQIPEGAIPVQTGYETRGMTVLIGAYGTTVVENAFYFPAPLDAAHYPAHVGRAGQLVAFAQPVRLNVVAEPSMVDTTSWEHISQAGSAEEVLAYLDRTNLQRTDLTRIAWRMGERGMFDEVIGRLRARHAYEGVLWSYGLQHRDEHVTREYLRYADGFLARCGRWLDTPLATIDPVERRAYQHIEYEPLFNARAHRFGRRREIMNEALARQYASLLRTLVYRPRLDDLDWMSVTYYLLLQDRIEEALASFARVDGARLPARIQYDYMHAYLDFFTDDHVVARGIAERYREHPVQRWRARFQDVLNQLDEAQGAAVAVSDSEDRDQRQTELAASEPALALAVEARRVTLGYQNLEQVEVSYYEMDVEFLFSTSPFVQQGSGSFAYIRPNRSDVLDLPQNRAEVAFELPNEFQSSNVLVEVRGGGKSVRRPYYANQLGVQTMESYGQLKVTHAETRKALPKVYVKVFARLPDGTVRFHKDGYTDLRGRFDYVSLSGESETPERYAVLVLSDTDGAVIREVDPPAQ